MLVICDIPDLRNTAGNLLTRLFIDYQGFTNINDFAMLCIKDVPRMIKDHNSVQNQEARLGAIQWRKLQALVWWVDHHQRYGLANI